MDHDFSSPDTKSRNTKSSEMTSMALGAAFWHLWRVAYRAGHLCVPCRSLPHHVHLMLELLVPFPLAPFVWVLCFRVLPWPTLISSKLSMTPPSFSYWCCLLLAYHCLITFLTFFKVMCWVKLQSFRERALSQMPTPSWSWMSSFLIIL